MLPVQFLYICKYFKMEAAFSYLQEKTGIILSFHFFSFSFFVFEWEIYVYIHSAVSR